MFVTRRSLCGLSPALTVEIKSIGRMGSASLREAAEAVMKSNQRTFTPAEATAVLQAVVDRASTIQPDMRYWDLVSIVQAYASIQATSTHIPLDNVTDAIRAKLSHLSPKHLVDLLTSLETVGHRPTELYQAMFNRMSDLALTSMYSEELVAVTRVMARHNIRDPQLLRALYASPAIEQLRLLHSCEVIGALAHLESLPQSLLSSVTRKCELDLEVMPLEELWRTVTGFENLVYSYRPLEQLAVSKLRSTIESVQPEMFDQVTRPIDFLQFIRINEWLTEDVLIAACKWANDAVYRPATRTQAHRRPTIFHVALLADLCRELDVPVERIEKAITVTVTSKGGTVDRVSKPKPLRYRRRRAYFREVDGYAVSGVQPVKNLPSEPLSEKKSNEAAFAPRLRAEAGGVPLWKSRSNAWFFRK